MKIKIKTLGIIFSLGLITLISPTITNASILFSQEVTLESGWNTISTPRVLDSHELSTLETSDNFDIYVLDPSNVSGWSTMADLGQTEFVPLYGYFINNKTGVDQTLTFNYESNTTPSERLFERDLSAQGWHSIGVANPTYVKAIDAANTDLNYPSSVLSSLESFYSSVIDLTSGNTLLSSVFVSEQWKSATSQLVNDLDDFRETKGYAIFINNTGGIYSGFQNNSIPSVAGSVTAERGALDPNTSATKEAGTTGYVFSAVKLTVGSTEDVTITSIRFNQSGTASPEDLTNVVVIVSGTDYPTTVSSDGKYYTANFGTGIKIAKGLAKDISIKGDIVSGSGRTIVFDIYESTDITIAGDTSGTGITPLAGSTAAESTTSSAFSTDGTPWYDNATVTVGTGSLNVSATNDVPVSSISDGGVNVSLGSFDFYVSGEPVTWSSLAITISTTSGSGTDGGELLTNVTLVNGNGSVLAGPQDPNSNGSTVTISDTVTLPVGTTTIYVKGNLNNNWENNDTIIVSFNPSSAISSVTGDTSGQSVTPTPSASVSGKLQTINAGSLTVTPSSSLVSQNIIDNSANVVLGRYVLDASASGEDLKITTVQIRADVGTNADVDELNSLTLYNVTNGANTALTTGSNVNNPSGNVGGTPANLSFTIDSGALTVAKGGQMIVELRGTVNASSTATVTTTFKMDFSSGTPNWTVTGADTSKDIVESLTMSAGATMTVVSSGTLTASLDSASPAENWYKSGDEATIGVLKFVATNEDMAVTDLGLALVTASSSATDFQSISLYNGSTLVKTLTSPAFTSGVQTFTFGTTGFVVPKGDDGASLTVKAKFSNIGTYLAGTSGNLVKIATSSTAAQNKAQGLSSGTSVNILGSASASEGARYFKSVPTVAHVALGSTVLSNGTKELYKFTVTANGGDLDIYKFTFNVATTGCDVSSFSVTESTTGKTVVSGLGVTGATTIVDAVVATGVYGATQITIPAGQTRTYVLTATVTGAGSGDSIVTQLEGDAAHIAAATTNGLSASNVDGDTNDDFIWSDRSASSHTLTTADWYNGYKANGLPTTNLAQSALSL